ncbi:replicase [Rehmannia allexivirus]
MSTQQVVTLFASNPKLEKLFATLVLPIEAKHKLPSLFPEIYKLEYYEKSFAYMPGGHGGGACVHTYGTLNWLDTARIGTHRNNLFSLGCTDFLSVEKFETKAAHHIYLIQRRRRQVEWPLPDVWVFHASEYVKLAPIFYPPDANVQGTYTRTLIMRMQAYCFSVKAVSLRDIFAKLRQVIETQELARYSMADLIRLANFLLFTTGLQQVADFESFLTKGFFTRLCANLRARIRKMCETLVGQASYSALLSVADVIPVYFTTKPRGRPCQGAEWFSGDGLESDDTDQDQLFEGPNPDDLDMLADYYGNLDTDEGDTACPSLEPPQEPHQQPEQRIAQTANCDTRSQPAAASATPECGIPPSTDHPPVTLETPQSIPLTDALLDEFLAETCGDGGAQPDQESSTPPNVVALPPQESLAEKNPKMLSDFDEQTTSILKLHGFTAFKRQHDGENWIQPVFFNPNTGNLPVYDNPKISKLGRNFLQLAEQLHRRFFNYTVCNQRATAFMSDCKNNLTGKVLPRLDRDKLSSWLALCETAKRQVGVLVIHGAGGAGKSRALQEVLRTVDAGAADINVVVPTVNLVTDWKKKMNTMDPRRFMTFEKACEREGNEVVIFDDYGKLPAGYIDAYLCIKPTVELIILTGDQRQSTHHVTNAEAQSARLCNNVQHFSRYCDYYINATHRQPRRLANPIKVHAERAFGGAVKQTTLIPDQAAVLVPSCKSQETLSGLGRDAYTYSGCQGLTLPHITIVLNNDTPLCSNEVLYTAFSRASETITLVNTFSDNAEFLAKLDSTPYLKTLISGVREDEDAGREHTAPEPEVPEPYVKTHLPVSNANIQLEEKVEAMEDKDTRELWAGDEKTNLMQTQDPVVQLFPHQQAKDEALFKITIKERIRTATPEDNKKAISQTLRAGDLLFEAYAKFMNVPSEPQPFDRDLWTHCRQLALRTYLSKPKTNLQQGAARQDPDFPKAAIALFNKSQWVKKIEKVGFKFKAGQTISAFKQETVALTTTMALYLRKKREEHQPDNVFIMCEKTPSQFDDFVTSRWRFDQDSYTSDYSQYDQSQDAAFLNFELRKAKHLGIPEEVLTFYRFVKTHAKTFVGNLAIMRLSGEGPTFDANTECNIAYDALRFQLSSDVNACYAGDDLVRDRVCPERPGWIFSAPHFQLKAKPCATRKPDFCGWRLTPYGIVKSPTQLFQSMQLAIKLGKLEDIKRSYAIDYQFAYRMGDRLLDIFDEDELEKHQLITRHLIKAGLKPQMESHHLPTFHITSDRLIRNPHYREMHDALSDQLLLEPPV